MRLGGRCYSPPIDLATGTPGDAIPADRCGGCQNEKRWQATYLDRAD